MEARLRKFSFHRREKPAPSLSTVSTPMGDEPPSVAYQSTSQDRRPIFIYQPLGKNARETKQNEESSLSLKGVAYASVPAGKAPMFSSRPVKGNGPIKLQTSHRSENGDMLTTTHVSQKTLDNIRDGDYIVGGKDKRESRQSRTSASPSGVSAASSRYPFPRQSTSHSATPSHDTTWPSTPTSYADYSNGAAASPALPEEPSTPISPVAQSSGQESWNSSSQDLTSRRPQSLAPVEERNAAITALYRAEYTRLTKLYGTSSSDRRPSYLDRATTLPLDKRLSILSGMRPTSPIVDPLQLRSLDSLASKRSSAESGQSHYDDTSDTSSRYRESLASSCAASSVYTTQTSQGDAESVAAREDIRKMIEEMRSTYIQAYEDRVQPLQVSTRSKSSKKKRKSKLSASPTLTDSRMTSDRQTWHGDDDAVAESPESDYSARRTTSHPIISPYSRLSTIEASPSKESSPKSPDNRPDLKRADSMTLGLLLGIQEDVHRVGEHAHQI